MRKIIIFSAFMLQSIMFGQGENLFEKGNAFYTDGEYQQAIEAYQTILQNGEESTALYYNLGNAHYKLNHIAESIYYYEKALLIDPNDQDVLNNLKYAQNATIDVIDTLPKTFFSRISSSILSLFHFDTWAWLSIVGIILFVVCFILYRISYSTLKKRLLFIGSMVFLIFSLITLVLAYQQYEYQNKQIFAIIFAEESAVRSEPNLRSEEIFELHPGTKVEVQENVGSWKKIKLADGKMGWIPDNDLKEI